MKRVLMYIGIITIAVFLIILNIKNVKNADYDTIRYTDTISISDNQGKTITFTDPDSLSAIRSKVYDVCYFRWNALDNNCDYEITFGDGYGEESLYQLNIGWTTFNEDEIKEWISEQLNYEDELVLVDLLDGELPTSIVVWSGLDGTKVTYTESYDIEMFIEIVNNEIFEYCNTPEEVSGGCDMAVTLYMTDRTISFVYGGGVFELFGDGDYYKIKYPAMNTNAIHEMTALYNPKNYN